MVPRIPYSPKPVDLPRLCLCLILSSKKTPCMLILPGKVLAKSSPALMGSSRFSSDRSWLARRSQVDSSHGSRDRNLRPDQTRYAAADKLDKTWQAERGDLQARKPDSGLREPGGESREEKMLTNPPFCFPLLLRLIPGRWFSFESLSSSLRRDSPD